MTIDKHAKSNPPTTETAGLITPLAQPPIAEPQTEPTPRLFFDDEDDEEPPAAINYQDDVFKMSKRLPLGGVLEATDPLRMVAMVRRTPFQFLRSLNPVAETKVVESCEENLKDPSPEPRKRCGRSSVVISDPKPKSDDDITDEDDETPAPQPMEDRKRKQKPKPRPNSSSSSSSVASSSKFSCCRQSSGSNGGGGLDDELNMRKETARLNLDVLRRLSSMLGEERDKFMAERQMLSASRDMMMAETKRVNSERSKLEAEKQKVDLERDLLQSQMLGRRSPRFDYILSPSEIKR